MFFTPPWQFFIIASYCHHWKNEVRLPGAHKAVRIQSHHCSGSLSCVLEKCFAIKTHHCEREPFGLFVSNHGSGPCVLRPGWLTMHEISTFAKNLLSSGAPDNILQHKTSWYYLHSKQNVHPFCHRKCVAATEAAGGHLWCLFWQSEVEAIMVTFKTVTCMLQQHFSLLEHN